MQIFEFIVPLEDIPLVNKLIVVITPTIIRIYYDLK